MAPVRIDPAGVTGPTRHQAAGPGFRQTSSGLYVPTAVDGTIVEQRILEQGSRLGAHGAVTGWAALRWHGARFFDGTANGGTRELPVPLVVGRAKIRPDPRVDISQAQLAPSERLKIAGIWCTTIQRALFDAMRTAPNVRAAVVCMDMAAAARLISVNLMSQYVEQRPAWTGVEIVRRALLLASNHSRSPQETGMRLVWVGDAGLPTPLCNVPVFSRGGRLLGYPDLIDVEAGMIGEYDGEHHKDGVRHQADVAREMSFRDHGLEYFAVVGGDLRQREMVVRRMHGVRSRALFEPIDKRRWTLEPPPWFSMPESLDHYLVRTGQASLLVRT